MSNQISVRKLTKDNVGDFYQINCEENELGWCHCVAWWCDSWETFANRSQSENEKQRSDLFAAGQYDGYVLYADEKPIGWCQAGPRDRHTKLLSQYELEPDQDVWSITCVSVIPEFRGMGLSHRFVQEVVADLEKEGVAKIQGFPVRGTKDPWTGPESSFKRAGFSIVATKANRPIYEWNQKT